MKRDVGWGLTAAVALAAVIGISTQRGGRSDTDAPRRPAVTNAAEHEAPPSKDPFEQGPCVEIEKHLANFLLGGKSESRAAPLSCYAGLKQYPKGEKKHGDDLRKAAGDLRFVIATLPGPAHTNFSLTFDRLTEAIQEAASDGDYVYDSSWLPWDAQDAPYALIGDQDKAEEREARQEEQPGIFLFRHTVRPQDKDTPVDVYQNGLVVPACSPRPPSAAAQHSSNTRSFLELRLEDQRECSRFAL
jgi:hypothetical protein